MCAELKFEIPSVTDEEIQWVSRLLQLPADAFTGEDASDPRRDVLKSMRTIDVAACPGSGKTTLLVAKLAILSQKWRYRTRGICVLSHTNAARHEIEATLGGTSVGQRLLSYPHYIGTIHGFVDDFLALPWLRSQGFPIKMIDTDICLERRWRRLQYNTRTGLERNGHGPAVLSIKSPDCSVGTIRWGRGTGTLSTDTATYRDIQETCRRSRDDGYFCYDEMLIWAEHLLATVPCVTEVIRERFPLLFIDEAQDNSEQQSKILHKIFLEEPSTVIRQRFGDTNQAIFDFSGATEASTDRFPSDEVKDLPNSHRFGQRIADLANPLGIVPHGLKGHGPKAALINSGSSEGEHTIFLFDNGSASKVLDAFGDLIVKMFSEETLRNGKFKAVGQVHRPPDNEEDHKFPHHVRHYWPDYDPELTRIDPKPKTFMQHVFAGRGKSETVRESHYAVEMVATGILRLAGMTNTASSLHHRRNCHRHVLKVLENHSETRKQYEELVAEFALSATRPTKDRWDNHWCGDVRSVAEAVAGESLIALAADNFLAWSETAMEPASALVSPRSQDNIYRCGNGKVGIHVGSIHAIKGETHTATLVLETYWYEHNLQQLLPWFDGSRTGANTIGARQQNRLKTTYVAMTRPTHLLCLAMKRSSIEDASGGLNSEVLQKLSGRGWKVESL